MKRPHQFHDCMGRCPHFLTRKAGCNCVRLKDWDHPNSVIRLLKRIVLLWRAP